MVKLVGGAVAAAECTEYAAVCRLDQLVGIHAPIVYSMRVTTGSESDGILQATPLLLY